MPTPCTGGILPAYQYSIVFNAFMSAILPCNSILVGLRRTTVREVCTGGLKSRLDVPSRRPLTTLTGWTTCGLSTIASDDDLELRHQRQKGTNSGAMAASSQKFGRATTSGNSLTIMTSGSSSTTSGEKRKIGSARSVDASKTCPLSAS